MSVRMCVNSNTVTARKQLMNTGALKRLVDLSRSSEEELCAAATGALWRAGRTGMRTNNMNCCNPHHDCSDENVRSLAKFDCIPHFVSLLSHRNDEIQTHAAGALANMALISMCS